MLLKIFPIIGDTGQAVGLDGIEGIGQRHVPMWVVMAIGLAVGSDMDDLTPVPLFPKDTEESIGKVFSFGEQALKGNSAGNGAIIKE